MTESTAGVESRSTIDRLLDGMGMTSIRARLLATFLVIVLLTAIPISIGALLIARSSGQDQVLNQLESVGVVKMTTIDTWLDSLQTTLASILTTDLLETVVPLLAADESETSEAERYADVRERLEWIKTQSDLFEEIFLLDTNGRSLFSTDLLEEGKIHINQVYFTEGLKGPYVSTPFYSPSQRRLSVVATRPILDEGGRLIGLIAGRANMDKLSEIMLERTGLGETGLTYLVGANHGLLTSAKGRVVTEDEVTYVRNDGVNGALGSRSSDSGLTADFRGVPVAGSYRWYPRLQVLVVAEQDQAEALGPIRSIRRTLLILTLLAVVFAILLSFYVSRRITTPIRRLGEAALEIETGNFDPDGLRLTRVMGRDDELGRLARVFQNMARQVYVRERRLRQQVQELQIVIDESKRQQQVAELTDNQFFQDLTQRAKEIRRRRSVPS